MLTLYYTPGASSMAAHIALHEVGASFEGKQISLRDKEQREPAYLAINVFGKVPTLVIDGRPLTEVAGILYYLARTFPQAKLLPDDAEGQAQVVSWMSFTASSLHPARAKGVDVAMELYRLVDKKLAGREWLVGDRCSIADIHLFRLWWRLVTSADVPRAEVPNLEAHFARMMQRPAVIKTLEVEGVG